MTGQFHTLMVIGFRGQAIQKFGRKLGAEASCSRPAPSVSSRSRLGVCRRMSCLPCPPPQRLCLQEFRDEFRSRHQSVGTKGARQQTDKRRLLSRFQALGSESLFVPIQTLFLTLLLQVMLPRKKTSTLVAVVSN